ncbi:hypothetical protein [Synechococcus sp. CBW1006]|uniref:hypothetical protein n=1 Tax=Synechococcus sp. CBW1006 TaxID=1353138 RepID=UPI0018CD8481|nr:hypothetical protein [Synechococcus sp. CBW1006]QPN65882.1 hypothetical protein H8F26_13510 [Synechococcus sp. CBW1006]
MRRLLIGGSPFQGRYPASEVNDGACPEKPDHLTEKVGAVFGLHVIAYNLIRLGNLLKPAMEAA